MASPPGVWRTGAASAATNEGNCSRPTQEPIASLVVARILANETYVPGEREWADRIVNWAFAAAPRETRAFLRAIEHRVSERRRWSLLRRYLELAESMMNRPEVTPLALRSKIYEAIFEIRSAFTREYRARWG